MYLLIQQGGGVGPREVDVGVADLSVHVSPQSGRNGGCGLCPCPVAQESSRVCPPYLNK
jgi:hypothetical protein